ncbi:MAG: enoyl-CoA hydratase/isomerase family protein [Ignavibacteriales bacterium]|nr:enoyl-CoA hydratase/isomerase family protein [Ignavibacteriales bacterium]
MDYQAILYSISNNILTVTLNRPDVFNAANEQMKKELLDAFKQAEKDPSVRCIILRGAGDKAFCSGQDLKEYQDAKSSMKKMLEEGYNPIIKQMRSIEKPVIGMINGVAAGAGFSFALACDLRILSDKAKLIQAFVRIGLVADSGSHWFLPRLVGTAKAFEYAATGKDIDATEAEKVGLVNKVVPHAELEKETYALAEKLTQGAPKAIGIIKRTLNKSLTMTFDDLLAYEAMMQEVAAQTDDHKEGLAAFIEKRPAKFNGR